MEFQPESVMYVSLFVLIIVHGVRLYLLKELIAYSVREYVICVLFPCMKVVVFTLLLAYFVNYHSPNLSMSVIQMLLTLLFTGIIVFFVGLNVQERSAAFQLVRKLL